MAEKIKIICDNCGKEGYHTPSQFKKNKHHFCSFDCSCEYNHKTHTEDRKCPICNNSFTVKKSNPKRFCSIKCQNEWQTTRTGEKNPNFQREIVNCEYCNKEFYVKRYKTKNSQHLFCSVACRQEWYAKVWSQQESWKEESRIRAVKILENRKIDTNTKPQIIVNNILRKLEIEYQNEKGFKYYAVDNYLSDYNLIVEVMGDFWHANPQVYNSVKYTKQKQVVSRDKAKHTYIQKYYDINILYLWEGDLCANPELCEKLIDLYIKSSGVLKNYHSFNYEISNGILSLKKEVTIPFQDI